MNVLKKCKKDTSYRVRFSSKIVIISHVEGNTITCDIFIFLHN